MDIDRDMKDRYAVVVHDPDEDGGDYVVAPFEDKDDATGYAEGARMVVGSDGSAMVMELHHPDDLVAWGKFGLGIS